MNKLTKLGFSALCGSLVSVASAYAGTMEVTGSANATWLTQNYGTTGNPLGQKTSLSFKGSGETESGQIFSATIDYNDKAAFSGANMAIETKTIGTFKYSHAEGGGGIGGYDDNMPNANGDMHSLGITTGADLAKGVGSSANVSWTSPTAYSSKLILAYTPKNDGQTGNDKAGGGAAHTSNKGRGFDVLLEINPQWDHFGINLFGGYSRSEKISTAVAGENDHNEATGGVTLTLGPLEVGAQRTFEHTGDEGTTEVTSYDTHSFGAAFNVNDSLSASYSVFKQMRSLNQGAVNTDHGKDSFIRGRSYQVALTAGGATLAVSQTAVDNVAFTAANDYEATLVSLTLAF